MASSWFLVLIPTKKYEIHLQTLNILDPNDKSSAGMDGEIKDMFSDATACQDKVIIHEPTEEEKHSGLRNSFQHPPIKQAQWDLNKPNEDQDLEDRYFEIDLQEALQLINVSQATYQLTKNENFYLVTFSLEASNVESALICLQSFGIGITKFTSISVVPASIHIDFAESYFDDTLRYKNKLFSIIFHFDNIFFKYDIIIY